MRAVGDDPDDAEAQAILAAVLRACEDLAEAAGVHVLVVAALESAVVDQLGVSLPADRLRAARLLKTAARALAEQVGLLGRS